MFRAVTVRKSSFPRGSPDFHQSPGRTDPLNCRPVTTKNRSWNFSDLEIFSNFFLSLFLSFSSAFIHPSPGYSVTTPSSGLRKMFHFFRLSPFLIFQLFDTVSLRPSDRLHFHRYQVTSFGQSSAAFWHFLKICYFFISNLFLFLSVVLLLSLSFSRYFIYFRPPIFFFSSFHFLSADRVCPISTQKMRANINMKMKFDGQIIISSAALRLATFFFICL